MAEAFVTPHLLTWARQRRGLEVEDLAKKLNVKPDAVNAWEAGERRPTFRQAQYFAQASYVPFGYLYLADPPVQELPLPDFRTIPGQPPREPSLDLLALMSDVLARIPHLAQTSDAVNRQLSCFSSRYMNLLAVFQI